MVIKEHAQKHTPSVVSLFLWLFLTHQNIAELTACTRQTVNSILTNLRERGIIDFDRKKLIIHNEVEIKKLK